MRWTLNASWGLTGKRKLPTASRHAADGEWCHRVTPGVPSKIILAKEDMSRHHTYLNARRWQAVAPINPICRRNPSIPGLCRIASPTCARPFELSLPWSVRLSSARAALHLENLALRQQLAALDRKGARPSLRMADRLFWVVLSRLWSGWREILVIVKPETVIGWHRKGFRRFWTRKSRRGKPGRPPVSSEFRGLIRRMSRENPLWGAPRIHGELRMLGFEVSEAAVSKYMPRIQSHLRRHGGRSSRTTSGA